MSNVGIIGDTHIPFEHPEYLDFCKETFKKYKCDQIVHIGDLVDNHSISYHEHDPDLLSPSQELDLAIFKLQDWYETFPKVKLCLGNHDDLPSRKGRTMGLPAKMINAFRTVYELPDEWEYEESYQIDDVKYFHGTGFSGKYAHANAAQINMQSIVMGHLHSYAGVEWIANDLNLIFGLQVGCGIDRKSPAFRYGTHMRRKPIIGCGVVINGGEDARFIPMPLG